MHRIAAHDRIRIAAVGVVSPGSVNKAYRDPSSVRPSTLQRVQDAARALGLPLPPPIDETGEAFTGEVGR